MKAKMWLSLVVFVIVLIFLTKPNPELSVFVSFVSLDAEMI